MNRVFANIYRMTHIENIPHIYFGVRMPMLYVVQHGGNYVPHPTKARDIVYVVVSIDKILKDGNISFFFSDGHATDYLTKFYTKDDIQQISEILDRKAILARQWSGENIDRDIKRRKQAEFLVKAERTKSFLDGFYSDFGLELLSSVDYIMSSYGKDSTNEQIYSHIIEWNQRKAKIFEDIRYINIAREKILANKFLNPE